MLDGNVDLLFQAMQRALGDALEGTVERITTVGKSHCTKVRGMGDQPNTRINRTSENAQAQISGQESVIETFINGRQQAT